MGNKTLKLGKYRHYKGGEYRVIGVGKHSETLEDVVIYEALYDNKLSRIWARPLDSFVGMADVDGTKVPRFEFLG